MQWGCSSFEWSRTWRERERHCSQTLGQLHPEDKWAPSFPWWPEVPSNSCLWRRWLPLHHSSNFWHKTGLLHDVNAYHLMMRSNYFCQLHRLCDLFHQYLVDMHAKVETERLLFIKAHQKELRVESYVHLRDGTNNDTGREGIGQLYILPSSFNGGPRYMHERTQDAITYVRHYGCPDLFITFTCNSTWDEVKKELFDGQNCNDRHDLLARVSRQR